MPIVLDDTILIPPSMRHGPPPRVYYNVTHEGGQTTTTSIYDSQAEHEHRQVIPRAPGSPVLIHQQTTSYAPSRELEDFSLDVQGRRGRGRVYYAGSEPGRSSRRRSISIDLYSPERIPRRREAELDYHHEDGRAYNYIQAPSESGRSHRSHHHRENEDYIRYLEARDRQVEEEERGRRRAEAELYHRRQADMEAERRRISEAEAHERHMRHLKQAGLAAGATVGALGAAKVIHDRRERRNSHAGYSSDSDTDHHVGRNIAGAALGATAAGIAAHKYRKHRQRSRSRSSDRYDSSSDTDNHTKRKIGGAILGATAAGLAAHKYRQRRSNSRPGSRYSSRSRSRSTSSDRDGGRHRKAKIAAGTAAAIGTGLAAKHYMNRRNSRSRSRSSSPERKSHTGRHIGAGVLGATAAGLAHHQYKNHQQRHDERPRPVLRRSASAESFRPRRRSTSIFGRKRSPSPGPGKIKTGLAAVAAAAVAKKAMDHYRESRARSPSPYGSRSRSRSVPKKAVAATMVGAAIAGHKLHKHHKEHEEERRQEARSRRNSAASGMPYNPNAPVYAHPNNGGGYVETIHSDDSSLRANTPPHQHSTRSRSNSTNNRLIEGIMKHTKQDRYEDPRDRRERRPSLGQGLNPESIAYKLGQTLASVTGGGRKEDDRR